jgi:hypothetical protein
LSFFDLGDGISMGLLYAVPAPTLEGKRGERRREHIKREFAQANLTQYHFWSAVDALTDQRLAKDAQVVTRTYINIDSQVQCEILFHPIIFIEA